MQRWSSSLQLSIESVAECMCPTKREAAIWPSKGLESLVYKMNAKLSSCIVECYHACIVSQSCSSPTIKAKCKAGLLLTQGYEQNQLPMRSDYHAAPTDTRL